LTIGAVKFRYRIKGYPQWHRSQEKDRLRDVVDFRTAEGMDEGKAGVLDGVSDGGLLGEFLLEP
jgi:hypothetical protein